MNTKSFKINIPEGYEIDKERSSFEEIVFKPVEKKLPKSWDDLKIIKGFYVDNNAEADSVSSFDFPDVEKDLFKNVFPTKEEAEASVALAQLCQLRDVYNEGWKPDWFNENQKKHLLYFESNAEEKEEQICVTRASIVRGVLTFKKEEVAKKFSEVFKDLIMQAKPLL